MRTLQGIGGAMMTPVGRVIVVKSVPRAQLVQAMNYITIPAVLGPLLGPSVGGFIVTYFSWPWIFFLNLPIGIARHRPGAHLSSPTSARRTSAPLDLRGFILDGPRAGGTGVRLFGDGARRAAAAGGRWLAIAAARSAACSIFCTRASAAASDHRPEPDAHSAPSPPRSPAAACSIMSTMSSGVPAGVAVAARLRAVGVPGRSHDACERVGSRDDAVHLPVDPALSDSGGC